jgi:hypothetical protein
VLDFMAPEVGLEGWSAFVFNGVERSAQAFLVPLRRTIGEEFGEVLFSILAVEEQISNIDLHYQFPALPSVMRVCRHY